LGIVVGKGHWLCTAQASLTCYPRAWSVESRVGLGFSRMRRALRSVGIQ
jgi:hypothetical protein